MPRLVHIPRDLGACFSVEQARHAGVRFGRLRSPDLERPFRGVRRFTDPDVSVEGESRRAQLLRAAHAYRARMRPSEFFSHETAAAIWGAPLPVGRTPHGVDVAVCGEQHVPRAVGVRGHRVPSAAASITEVEGLRVASPASTWAMLGAWSVTDLVALGDYFCRVWRVGHGRPDPGRPPLTTVESLGEALKASRRIGAARLREALGLIRCDAWSPRETACRLRLVAHGLPEPELNMDVFDRFQFLGCVDLAYPQYKLGIEYHGALHHATYAEDVERIARFRADDWTMLEVTNILFRDGDRLERRAEAALRSRGWRP